MFAADVTLKRFKSGFLDREKIASQMSRENRKKLMRFGGFTRLTARRSLRRRKKISSAGQPPHTHTKGKQNLKFILFAYDRASESVITGPVKFNSSDKTQSDKTIPELLEKGGSATVIRRGKKRKATYKPRPFMAPAFEKAQQELPEIWRQFN